MKTLLSFLLRGVGRALLSIVNMAIAFFFVGGLTVAIANYTMTQGTGTNFASVVLGGTVHYAAQMICDFTAGVTQCAKVDSSGALTANLGTLNGASTAANQTTANASLATIASQTAGIGSALPVQDQVGGGVTPYIGDPCQTTNKITVTFFLTSAAVKVLVTGTPAKKIYVCHIHMNNSAADSVALFDATTATTCATSPNAIIGSGTTVATAGQGYNFSANGGISLGTGGNEVLATTTNANDLCVAQSAATQLSGAVTYAVR